ncbi:hypothetical protein GCM10028812_41470 [Ancylobacter sonchi]
MPLACLPKCGPPRIRILAFGGWRYGEEGKPEEIVGKLRQVDVLVLQGRPVAEAIRMIEVTASTCTCGCREFGSLNSDLKDLEK